MTESNVILFEVQHKVFKTMEQFTEAKGGVYIMLKRIDRECMIETLTYEETRKTLTDYMKANHPTFNDEQIEYCIDAAMSISIGYTP
jgi:hypothetical protein